MSGPAVQFETNAIAIGLELGDAFATTPCWVLYRAHFKDRPTVAMEFAPAILANRLEPDTLALSPRTVHVPPEGDDAGLERILQDASSESYDALADQMWGEQLAGLADDFPQALFVGYLSQTGTVWVVLDCDPDSLRAHFYLPVAGAGLGSMANLLGKEIEAWHARGKLHLDISADFIGTAPDGVNPLGPPGALLRSQAQAGGEQDLLARPETAPPELFDLTERAPVGPWTDIYQASATLFLLATGKPRPHWSTSVSEARELLDKVPTLAWQGPLKAMIAGGLEPVIANRPASVAHWMGSLGESAADPEQAPEEAVKAAEDQPVPEAAPLKSDFGPEIITRKVTPAPSLSERFATLRASVWMGLLAAILVGIWPIWNHAYASTVLTVTMPATVWLCQAMLIALTQGTRPVNFAWAFRPALPVVSYAAFAFENDFDRAYMAGLGLFGTTFLGFALFVLPALFQIAAFVPRTRWYSFCGAAILMTAINLPGTFFPVVAETPSAAPSGDASATQADASASPMPSEETVIASDAAVEASTVPSETPGEAAWNGLSGRWRKKGEDCSRAWVVHGYGAIDRPDGSTWWFKDQNVLMASGGDLEASLYNTFKNGKNAAVGDRKFTFRRTGNELTMRNVDGATSTDLEFVACPEPSGAAK